MSFLILFLFSNCMYLFTELPILRSQRIEFPLVYLLIHSHPSIVFRQFPHMICHTQRPILQLCCDPIEFSGINNFSNGCS